MLKQLWIQTCLYGGSPNQFQALLALNLGGAQGPGARATGIRHWNEMKPLPIILCDFKVGMIGDLKYRGFLKYASYIVIRERFSDNYKRA